MSDELFNQMANISKAHAYDIIVKQRDELYNDKVKLLGFLASLLELTMTEYLDVNKVTGDIRKLLDDTK